MSTIRRLFANAPRDLWASMVIMFFESVVYFSFSYMLMLYLIDEVGMSDQSAGNTYAVFGVVISIFTVVFGGLVDRLLVRKTMLLQLWVGLAAKLALALVPNRYFGAFVMYVPLSFTVAVGTPLISVSIRRYTTQSTQSMAFALQYITMNVGAAVSQLAVDAIRLHLVPLGGTAALAWRPAYSTVIGFMALPHMINIAITTLFIRDVEVINEEWHLQPSEALFRASGSSWWQDTKRVMGNGNFWKFVLMSFSTTGVKAVYRYLDTLYPIFMKRAPYPVADPEAVPYLSFLVINTLIVIVMTGPFAALVSWRRWHPFYVILAGVCVMASSAYFMMIIQYWAVIIFIVVMSLGEVIWAPLLAVYALYFCKKGEEGIFLSLSVIPLFAGKILTGALSGKLLTEFCPAKGAAGCPGASIIWLIIGCIAVTSPVLLVISARWIKIDKPVYDDDDAG